MGALSKKKVHPYCKIEKRVARVNGWSSPLHRLQILAFLCFFIFAASYFGLMVPMLPKSSIKWLALAINGVIFVFHFIIHLLSVSIDPADQNVINKYKQTKNRIGNTFDRTKHRHVIENQFCYICEVNVGPKSKHCSVCNKCVSDFDHHCKWLNNCVGGKNYRLFICCVVSATVGTIIVFALSAALTNAFFTKDSWLHATHFQNSMIFKPNNSSFWDNLLVNHRSIWIMIIIITLLASFLALILLFHLLCFHIFLYLIGLSTYEFMIQRRQKENVEMSSNQESSLSRVKRCLFSKQCKSYANSDHNEAPIDEEDKSQNSRQSKSKNNNLIVNTANHHDKSGKINPNSDYYNQNHSSSSIDWEEQSIERSSKSDYIESFVNQFKSNQLTNINLNSVTKDQISPIYTFLANDLNSSPRLKSASDITTIRHPSLDHISNNILNHLNIDQLDASLQPNHQLYALYLNQLNKKRSQRSNSAVQLGRYYV